MLQGQVSFLQTHWSKLFVPIKLGTFSHLQGIKFCIAPLEDQWHVLPLATGGLGSTSIRGIAWDSVTYYTFAEIVTLK